MDPFELREPDDEQNKGERDTGKHQGYDESYDDWYRLISPDPTPEEMPDAPQDGKQADADVLADCEDHGPIPFGEDGAAFLRNILQHGVFLGAVMVILMIIHYARR